MMYDSKMALAVKTNGRVLREVGDAVYIPFGCEYSLLLKNLNSVRALVRVWIDGTDVTEGTQLVVRPNQSFDLERFIKNGNREAGNKFKFIERTAAISDHRGNKIDDGLIRVEFEFEQPPVIKAGWTTTTTTTWPVLPRTPYDQLYTDLVGRSTFGDTTTYSTNTVHATGASGQLQNNVKSVQTSSVRAASRSATPQAAEEVGITVAGGVSDQKFTEASWFPTDGIKHVMVMRVLGEAEGQPVLEPVTVKTKTTCPSCGKHSKAGTKFCENCGTGLQIV